MNCLVVGFGNIGCRHVQSLLELDYVYKVLIIEPNKDVFNANLKRINASESLSRIEHLQDVYSISGEVDFAVIATSAQPRLEIMRKLIVYGIKHILLEKVVFQSETQFNEAIRLVEDSMVNVKCNFVNRYYKNYYRIKSTIKKDSRVVMTVSGGDFGLACNSLHYVDLFSFLVSERLDLVDYKLVENNTPNRRGDIYKEVVGTMLWKCELSDSILMINSDPNRIGGVEIVITIGSTVHLLNEQVLSHWCIEPDKELMNSEFEIRGSSKLTSIIMDDMMNGKCWLPSLRETKMIHVPLFKAVNSTLKLAENELCPIT